MTEEKMLYKNLGATEVTKEEGYTIMYCVNGGRARVFSTGFRTREEAQNRVNELQKEHSRAFSFGVRKGKASTIGFGPYSPIAFCR